MNKVIQGLLMAGKSKDLDIVTVRSLLHSIKGSLLSSNKVTWRNELGAEARANARTMETKLNKTVHALGNINSGYLYPMKIGDMVTKDGSDKVAVMVENSEQMLEFLIGEYDER